MPIRSDQPQIPGMREPKWTKEEKDKFHKKWVHEGEVLAGKQQRSQWDLGDWLIVGNRRLLSLAYTEAEKITGLARPTLLDIKGTADRFDDSTASRRRDPRLSWSHHKELKRIKDDNELQKLKDKAIEKGLSVQGLRKAVDEVKESIRVKEGKPVPPKLKSLVIKMSFAEYERLERRAAEQKLDPKELAASVISKYVNGNSEDSEAGERRRLKPFMRDEELVAS
jgi:hypothetical protein